MFQGRHVLSLQGLLPSSLILSLAQQRASILSSKGERLPLSHHGLNIVRVGDFTVDLDAPRDGLDTIVASSHRRTGTTGTTGTTASIPQQRGGGASFASVRRPNVVTTSQLHERMVRQQRAR